jgi:hypothetical protein
MTADPDLEVLVTFLQRVPGIVGTIGNEARRWTLVGEIRNRYRSSLGLERRARVRMRVELPFCERAIAHRVHARVPSAISERWPASIPLVGH